MYLRSTHADLHIPTLYKFIRANPLGILTTAIPIPGLNTIQSSHIPWILDVTDENETETSTAKLRGHIARANPQCKALIEAATKGSSSTVTEEVMILFNGPASHYVTPKFYVETKPVTGKVVPTWDYSAVQVYGTATLFFDTTSPSTDAFISKAISDLSRRSEEEIFGFTGEGGKPKAWEVGEAPESYIALLKKAIVGIEIEIKSIGGKFKMSQELKDGDRKGVIEGFEKLGSEVGDEIARAVREREEVMKNAKKDRD
jgi:transcriptional regulator